MPTALNLVKYLVLVNLHLEAYDDGEGKKAQTEMLKQILQEEADQGNYVIAGGDFNQTFSGTDDSMYPELKACGTAVK
jgi:endonuclease/exonuclease/phosphatase family metal-dependent hydrolase